MGEQTAISWCDHTWSPWYGCTQVSMGPRGACEGCYARQLSEIRMGRVVFGGPGRGDGTRDVRADAAWKEPLRWNRTTPGAFVFPSMCDPFDNHPDLAEPRRRFFDLIRATPNLTWLLLTKRPGNIVKLFEETLGPAYGPDGEEGDWYLPDAWPLNAAIGFTAPNQEEFDRDWPKARQAFRTLHPPFLFLSNEPALGGVALPQDFLALGPFAWVITGGETDQGAHKARPSHPGWFRAIRDQCAAADVAYHHKQNGEWAHSEDNPPPSPGPRFFDAEGSPAGDGWHFWADGDRGANASIKVGKADAGRLLDGATHDARPTVEPRGGR